MELVTINEIKKANDARPRVGLQNIIKNMETFDQKKYSKEKFEQARDAMECFYCGKVIANLYQDKEEICVTCAKNRDAEVRRALLKKELNAKWQDLLTDLNEQDEMADDLYILETPNGDFQIKRISDGLTLYIYRDTIYSGSGYYASKKGHALRISTSDWDLKADRLKRDFKSKGVAKALHKKCEELIKVVKARREIAEREEKTNGEIVSRIFEAFPEAEDIRPVYVRRGHTGRLTETSQKKFQVGGKEISTYDGKRFTLTVSGLTAEEASNIVHNYGK